METAPTATLRDTIHVVATTVDGTEAALRVAVPLSKAVGARLVVVVPHLVPYAVDLDDPLEPSEFFARRYEGVVRSLNGSATIDVCCCRRIDDIVGRVASGAAVVIGGPVGRWLTSPEERFANLLSRYGRSVVFVATGCNVSQRRTAPTFAALFVALIALAGSPARAQSSSASPRPAEPFTFADFTWLSGSPRTKDAPLDSTAFTGEFRVDTNFTYSFNKPIDDTIVGSSEVFRSGEFQLTQLGVGGDFHYENVRGRLMTQLGMYAQTTPRNDASTGRGQWDLNTAYRYISEAYGGYHFDALHGVNVDAGIFMSYIGLWSYYQFDNWTYQPSFVSSNTPWFFNGLRVQIFASEKLKIEPWVTNGWQSYGKFNHAPGVGGQVLWRPTGSISVVANNYWGTDTLGNPDRERVHTDDSVQVKYHDAPEAAISKAAFTFTFDAGCELGGGVSCGGGTPAAPSQTFLGFMAYHRAWFDRDRFAVTIGGGAIDNPGRYLVLMPPINGATAFSGTPYFTLNPGDPFKAWDAQATFDFMPSQFATFRAEYDYRHASVPYFAGQGGVTPPGGNTGAPGSVVDGWTPDLRQSEKRVSFALLVKL